MQLKVSRTKDTCWTTEDVLLPFCPLFLCYFLEKQINGIGQNANYPSFASTWHIYDSFIPSFIHSFHFLLNSILSVARVTKFVKFLSVFGAGFDLILSH